MKMPRKPISIQAAIEHEGARILGTEVKGAIPAGTLVPWNKLDCSSGYYQVIGDDGIGLEVEGKKVFLRFGSYWKSPQQSTRLKIQQAKKSWYRDRTNEFKLQLIPEGGIRKLAREASSGGLMLGVFLIFVAAVNSIPALNRPNPIARTVDHWVMLGILIVAFVFIFHSFITYRKLVRSTWVSVATHEGVLLRSSKNERFVPWSKVELLRKKFVLYQILIEGKEVAYLFPHLEIRLVLESRLLLPEPKLFTGAFVLIVAISMASGPLVMWFYKYLQVPADPILVFVSGFMLLLCGVIVWHNRLELRDVRKANESLEQDFPKNS